MSFDSPLHCVVVKNVPNNCTMDEVIRFMYSNGCEQVHHARLHNTNHNNIIFMYMYSIGAALYTVANLNHISLQGKNLHLSLHKDSKSEITSLLWDGTSENSKKTKRR